MTQRPYGRAILPGRILLGYLEARGWTQKRLAKEIGRPYQAVNEIIQGKKTITADTAIDLAEALDTSPEFWLYLEAHYQLALARERRELLKEEGT